MILTIYEIILLITLSSILGVICALFSYLLDFCFWPGSIFKMWLPWLASYHLKRREPKIWTLLVDIASTGYGDPLPVLAVQNADQFFWYKILGGCAVCFNIWIALISWSVICTLTFFQWYYGIPYILISSWLIRRLVKATY